MLNRVLVPTDIVFLVVFWRLRYKLLPAGARSKFSPQPPCGT
jgi:hypothetical protein